LANCWELWRARFQAARYGIAKGDDGVDVSEESDAMQHRDGVLSVSSKSSGETANSTSYESESASSDGGSSFSTTDSYDTSKSKKWFASPSSESELTATDQEDYLQRHTNGSNLKSYYALQYRGVLNEALNVLAKLESLSR